ncbi:MAG: flavin reductase family protein [Planctomycetota bacterium]
MSEDEGRPNEVDALGADAIGAALGRVPSGLFIVTTLDERGQPMGFLGSFVQQVGLDPPTVCVAISTEREHLDAVRASGRFAVSILGDGDKGLMKPFFKKPEDGSPFDDVAHGAGPGGTPVLEDALSWVECRVAGEHHAGDHVVVFGVVEAGERRRDGEPMIHVRKNGLRYS